MMSAAIRRLPHLRRLAAALAVALAAGAGAVMADAVSIEHRSLPLNGELRLADGKTLGDGVILMVHGTMAHHRMEIMQTLQALLAEREISSLAVTLGLGVANRRGMFDCGEPHRHRHVDALAEIGAWSAWLRSQGARLVVLLGHSRGGNQAARYALEHAAGLAGVVLVAPMTDEPERRAETYSRRHGVELGQALARARGAAPDTMLEATPFLSCAEARVSAGSFLSYYDDDPLRDTPSLLPRITVPTLVIAGSDDAVVPDVAARSRPHLDANTKLVVIDGAGHFFRDLYAEDVADAVAEFVDGLQ